MTKSTFFTISALAFLSFIIFSCSKDVSKGSIYGPSPNSSDNHPTCYECIYSSAVPSGASTVCNINDTIVNIITNGVLTSVPLDKISFDKYIESLETGGASCTFIDTPVVVIP